MRTPEEIARKILGDNLTRAEDASGSDDALRTVEYSGDRVRIMLADAARAAQREATVVTDGMVQRFRDAWHEADTRGEVGNRVRSALVAALGVSA